VQDLQKISTKATFKILSLVKLRKRDTRRVRGARHADELYDNIRRS